MWAVIRNPERYRCAVSLAGVTDWSDMLSYDRKYLDRTFYRRVWKQRVEGAAGNFESDAYSPRAQIKRLNRPVLIAHGKEDERVPFRQYETMVKVARAAGKPIEVLALEDGHNLEKEENEALFLETLIAFLARHNPAD